MSLLDYVLTDPALRARQDQLDAQWNSARAVFGTCDNTPDSAFSEFTTDYNNWKNFYKSGTDWSSDALNATNSWQATLKSWTDRFSTWGCTGNFTLTPGTVGADDQAANPDPSGVPGVKDPPPDAAPWYSNIGTQLSDEAKSLGTSVSSFLTTASWVVIGIVVLIVVALVYTLTRASFNTPYGSINE